MHYLRIYFQEHYIDVRAKVFDDEINWVVVGDANDENTITLNAVLSENFNDKICDLITEKLDKNERENEMDRHLSVSEVA